MKFVRSLFLALLLVPALAFAQSATPVQAVPQHLDACNPISFTNAVNTVTTATITPPGGQYVYICGLDLNVSNSATGAVVSTNLTFTSTNLGGWLYKFSSTNAANTNGLDKSFVWNPIIRSAAPGVAVTIVSPAVNAQAAYTITVYYYFAI